MKETTLKKKQLILNQKKINLARKILGADSETETIEKALDFVIDEVEINRKSVEATNEFLKSQIEIEDVFENMV